MKLLRHKHMKTVSFFPVRIVEERRPSYLKVFGYWYVNQLKDLNGLSETIEITNLEDWQYIDSSEVIDATQDYDILD